MAITLPFSKGVNFTKWFETRAFSDIDFPKYTEQDFIDVKKLGADVVRLPVRFHDYTLKDKDNTLEKGLFEYLDTVIDWAQKHSLYLILDNHSFHSINATDVNIDKILIPVWQQLASHYKDYSDFLIYEVLNEPHDIADERWNEIQEAAIKAIRSIDNKHFIVIGGTGYNSIEKMTKVPLYKNDKKLIYTFHFYDPHIFTHQGAVWNKPSLIPLKDLSFPPSKDYLSYMHDSFKDTWVESSLKSYEADSKFSKLSETLEKAAAFSKENDVPIFCGEFGVYMLQSPALDRVKWYEFICEELAKKNIPWTCWDYFGGFGIFKTQERGLFPTGLDADIVNAMGFKKVSDLV